MLGRAALDRVAIDDQDERPADTTQQMLDERLEVVGLDVMVEDVELQPQAAAIGETVTAEIAEKQSRRS